MSYSNSINNKLGDNFLLSVTDLVSLDITGMSVTPIVLLPSPGAGKFIGIDFWSALRGAGAAYTAGGTLQLLYTTSGNVLSSVITGSVMTTANPQIGSAGISNTAIPLANMLNNGISIKNNTAPFATGNAPARFILKYTIFEVP